MVKKKEKKKKNEHKSALFSSSKALSLPTVLYFYMERKSLKRTYILKYGKGPRRFWSRFLDLGSAVGGAIK